MLPDDPRVWLTAAKFDSADGRVVQVAADFTRVAAVQPELLGQVDISTRESVVRQLAYARRTDVADQLVETLVSAGYGRENPNAFSRVLSSVLMTRARAGKAAEAAALLPSMLSPRAGVTLLIDRRLAPIWPDIERWAGDDFAVQRTATLAAAQARFAAINAPVALLPYSTALYVTGHRDEAIALLRTWVGSRAVDEDGRYYLARATVSLAQLLAETGRRKEGIAMMRTAVSAPDADQRAVANIVPTLVAQLLVDGDAPGALALLDRYTPDPETLEAPAAQGYFVALRGCALARAARPAEAKRAFEEVASTFGSNTDAVAITTQCGGTMREQVAAWLARADDDSNRADALIDFAEARYRANEGLPVDSLSDGAMRHVIADPLARKRYDELARPVPPRYRAAMVGFNAPSSN